MSNADRPIRVSVYAGIYLILLGATYIVAPSLPQPVQATSSTGVAYILVGAMLLWHGTHVFGRTGGAVVNVAAIIAILVTSAELFQRGLIGPSVAHALLAGALLVDASGLARNGAVRTWDVLGLTLGGTQVVLGMDALLRGGQPPIVLGNLLVGPGPIGAAYLFTGLGVMAVNLRWVRSTRLRNRMHLAAGLVLFLHWFLALIVQGPGFVLAVAATAWRTVVLAWLPFWERVVSRVATRTLRVRMALLAVTIVIVTWTTVAYIGFGWAHPAYDRNVTAAPLVTYWSLVGLLIAAAWAGLRVADRVARAVRRAVSDDSARSWRPSGVAELDTVAHTVSSHLSRIEVLERLHEAEHALHASEERLRLAAEAASIGTYDMDLTADRVVWSPEACAILGLPVNSVARLPQRIDLVHPDDRAGVEQALAAAFAPGGDGQFAVICRIRMADTGEVRWVSTRGRTTFEGSGDARRAVRHTGVLLDVTAERMAEERLRADEQLFRAVFNQQFQFVAILSPEGIVRQINDLPVTMTGVPREAVSGRPFWETPWWQPLPEMQRQWPLRLEAAARAVGPVLSVDEYALADGSVRLADCAITAVRDARGDVDFFLVQAGDITERTRVEQQLRASEERGRLALEGADLGSFDIDLRANVAVWSRRHAELQDHPAQAPGSIEAWRQRIHADDVDGVLAAIDRARLDRTTFTIEHRVARTDGADERWLALYGRYTYDDAGEAIRLSGVSRDVTARRAADEVLRRRNRQLDFLARTAQRLLIETEPDRTLLTSIFSELAELLGYDCFYHFQLSKNEPGVIRLAAHGGISAEEEQLFRTMRLGDPLCGIVAQCRARLLVEDLQHSSRPGAELLRSAGITSYVGFPLITHNALVGTAAFLSRTRTHLREGDLQVIETTCDHVATAIQKARLAAEVRDREEQLRRVIEAMHIFVGVLTPDGVMVECNEAPIHAARQSREDVIGVHFADSYWWAYSAESQARVRADIGRAASGEAVRYDAPVRVRGADGEPAFIDVDFALTPLRDSTGNVTHLVPIGIDISARTRAEAALRDADRQKDEFIAVLAHELRNPIAPIRTSVGVLKALGIDDPAIVKCRHIIDRQVTHMARLLDDLLDVSRLSRGTLLLQRAPVRLADVVGQAVEAVTGLIEARGQSLTIAPVDPQIVLDADPARLAQILNNLLNNAAKYTDRGGTITVRTELTDAHVVVHVEDTGIGLHPAMRDRIFDLFAQVEGARTRSEDGLGIGLNLTKRLVEMHGGTIVASSPGLGKGTTMTVMLPVRASVAPQTENGRGDGASRTPRPRRRVLIVDDNADAADTMAMLFDTLGCDTRTAYDGSDALRTTQSFQPDLVLLDLGMPGLDGHDVCRQLREEPSGPGMVIAAVTGWGQDADRRRTTAAGFDFHLVKPVEPEALERLVRELPQHSVVK